VSIFTITANVMADFRDQAFANKKKTLIIKQTFLKCPIPAIAPNGCK
jgi:hypothetical protein